MTDPILAIPDHVQNQIDAETFEAQLPKPVGYRVLVALPEVEEEYEGGIIKAESVRKREYIMSIMGLVLDMGDLAYKDESRFGKDNAPWCKVGDYVMFRMNTGTRFTVSGKEYRLMNDDSIEAVIADPRGITHA
jgi:co-chaperonin GroES (HSP10)